MGFIRRIGCYSVLSESFYNWRFFSSLSLSRATVYFLPQMVKEDILRAHLISRRSKFFLFFCFFFKDKSVGCRADTTHVVSSSKKKKR